MRSLRNYFFILVLSVGTLCGCARDVPHDNPIDPGSPKDPTPQIINSHVAVTRIDQWWPGPVYMAVVSANVTDPNGYLDTVYVKIDSLTFGMSEAAGSNYQVEINADSLPNQDIQWLIGEQLNVYAIDRENRMEQSAAFYVTRIIDAEAVPASPTDLAVTTGYPQFNWNPATVSFDYSNQVQIYQINSGYPTPVGTPIKISPDSASYDYPDSLPAGQYSWTITIVDDFGNSSTSKEASFQVQ
ncbi:MAG: hypothetical protein ACLP05_05035 [Candidatus Kryptoniota bacterium]